MRVIKRINPGNPGSKRYLELFGEKLICVRYRHSKENHERVTTVELIVDKGDYYPEFYRSAVNAQNDEKKLVYLNLGFDDKELRCRVIKAGGMWVQEKKYWEINISEALELGLEDKIVK